MLRENIISELKEKIKQNPNDIDNYKNLANYYIGSNDLNNAMLVYGEILKISQNQPPIELAKKLGMHEFVVKQTLEKLKNSKISDLVKLKDNLFNVEYKIKSAEAIDIISEVECAIIR